MVAYAVTGILLALLALVLLESAGQAEANRVQEKAWARKQNAPMAQAGPAVA